MDGQTEMFTISPWLKRRDKYQYFGTKYFIVALDNESFFFLNQKELIFFF